MASVTEALQQAKQRVNPEGLAISGTLAGASILAIPILQVALTYAINESSREVPTDMIKLAAVGILACTNLASIAVESETLRYQKYSASPIVSTINVATGKPVVSSALGHAKNFVQSCVLNPVNIISIGSLMTGDEGRMFAENAVGVGLSLGLWNMGFNTLISSHHIEPVVNRMKNARLAVSKRFKKNKI